MNKILYSVIIDIILLRHFNWLLNYIRKKPIFLGYIIYFFKYIWSSS